MRFRPGPKLQVDPLQQFHVLGVVLFHLVPGGALPGHTFKPHLPLIRRRELTTYSQVLAQIVQLVGVEGEVAPSNLERVYGLVRGWGC